MAYLSGDVLYGLRFFGDRRAAQLIDAVKQVMEAPAAGFRTARPSGETSFCYSAIPFVRVAGDIGDCYAQVPGTPTILAYFFLKGESLVIHFVDGERSDVALPLKWERLFDERLF